MIVASRFFWVLHIKMSVGIPEFEIVEICVLSILFFGDGAEVLDLKRRNVKKLSGNRDKMLSFFQVKITLELEYWTHWKDIDFLSVEKVSWCKSLRTAFDAENSKKNLEIVRHGALQFSQIGKVGSVKIGCENLLKSKWVCSTVNTLAGLLEGTVWFFTLVNLSEH